MTGFVNVLNRTGGSRKVRNSIGRGNRHLRGSQVSEDRSHRGGPQVSRRSVVSLSRVAEMHIV